MRSFTILAALAAVVAADNIGTIGNPISTQLSDGCPLSECYVEPESPQKKSPPSIACALGFSGVDKSTLPNGCQQRCKPCRSDICTTVCEFEAYCDSGDCPAAMAQKMSGEAACPGGNKA